MRVWSVHETTAQGPSYSRISSHRHCSRPHGGNTAERNLWVLRLLVHTPAVHRLDEAHRIDRFLGLLELSEAKAERMRPATLARHAARRLEHVEHGTSVVPDPLTRSAFLLGSVLGFSQAERSILALAAGFSVDDLLREALELAACTGPMEIYAALAAAVGHDPRDVRRALRPGGVLHDSGLVQMSWTDGISHEVPLRLMHGLDEMLLGDVETADDILEHLFTPSPPPALRIRDIEHLREELEMLRIIAGPAVQTRTSGINVLIHGPTGAGKTQLARLLARELSVSLFEVACDDADGDPLEGHRRLSAYVLCQRMLSSGTPSMVLFDEAEDVFPKELSFLGLFSRQAAGKAWTSRLLESNPVPAIWVANHVDQIDPAYLRRFVQVIELHRPPARVRRRLVTSILGPLGVTDRLGRRMAADERLSPGHLEATARALKLAAPEPGEAADALAGRLLESSLALQGGRAPSPALHDGPSYDQTLVNASEDLEHVICGLERSGRGRICLYGPPGTGKTAFAYHAAERLGRPLLLRRASDLLDPFVGVTEKAIAAMFREASSERAALLLDEADGMLRDRRGSSARWELTQTNEMLTQMEAFDGVFFCATNLVDELDRASLRRFDLKIRLDPPRASVRWRLILSALAALGGPVPGTVEEARLRREMDRLAGLTPGDVTAVIRRMRILGVIPGADRLVEALAEELCARREPSARVIGFKAPDRYPSPQENRPLAPLR